MAAHDNLSMDQFPRGLYHGTDATLKPGDMLQSPRQRGIPSDQLAHKTEWDSEHLAMQRKAVFATPYPGSLGAGRYGAHVYKVEPTGPLHASPKDSQNDVHSFHPMRVTEKISGPGHPWIHPRDPGVWRPPAETLLPVHPK